MAQQSKGQIDLWATAKKRATIKFVAKKLKENYHDKTFQVLLFLYVVISRAIRQLAERDYFYI